MSPYLLIGLIFTLITMNGLGFSRPPAIINTSNPITQVAIPFRASNYQTTPVKKDSSEKLSVLASSAIIYDVRSAQRLYEKQPTARRAVASLNKLMTALVIMDSHKPDEIITVGDLPTLGSYDVKIGISKGEKFKLIDLLRAVLIHSANDAANALAIHDSGSIENFANKMNQKAKEWELDDSNFINPSGLDDPAQLSSANNLLVLSTILLHNQTFREIVKTPATQITNLQGKQYTLTTTNKILGKDGISGVKTGFTLNAGQCLITLAERDDKQILTVVLDSPDRFQESKNMIDWAFNNHTWQ